MPNILDPRFRYVPAAQTDIRRTFARARARLAAERGARLRHLPGCLFGQEEITDADRDCCYCWQDQQRQRPAAARALPQWMRALAADERADIDRAAAWRDIDTRR